MTTPSIEAVKVHIATSDVPFVTPLPGNKRRAVSLRTFVLTSSDPVQQILGLADNRIEAWIQNADAVTLPEISESASFTAGAGGSAFLPSGSFSLTGFDVTIAPSSAGTVTGTVTAATFAGGNLIYDVSETTTSGIILAVRYPGNGLQPLAPNVAGVIVSTMVNGGAGHINVYGRKAATKNLIIAGSKADVLSAGNSAVTVPVNTTTPFPIPTTDAVWASAASADLPVTISVTSIIEE